MNREQIKDWADFYGKAGLIAAWNGFLRFGYVFTGAAGASAGGLIDLSAFGWKGILYTLLGTILASVFGEIYKHPLPTPKEPTP